MNKNWIFLSLILLITSAANLIGQQVALNEWRVHIPYSNPRFVVDDGEKIFTANNLSMYSFDKEDNSVQRFSKVSGMSMSGPMGWHLTETQGHSLLPTITATSTCEPMEESRTIHSLKRLQSLVTKAFITFILKERII